MTLFMQFPTSCYPPLLAMSLLSSTALVRAVILGTRIFMVLLMDQNVGSTSFQGLFEGLITDLTGMCRPGWCPANKPRVAKRFRYPMSELSLHTASSTCLSTRSLECTSEGKVCVAQYCKLDCWHAAVITPRLLILANSISSIVVKSLHSK